MKGPSINGKYTIMAEINMIPFIDIALVLLIIFMVITPVLVKSEILIKPPVVNKGDPTPNREPPIRVQVDKAGAVFIEGRAVAGDTLGAALGAVLPTPATQSLLIEADQDAAFQHVARVMSAAKELGVSKVAVSVLEEKKKPTKAKP